MSQRKSPVAQHTLTGPRVPTVRGRNHRPTINRSLYIANPDTDSDSDEPQRPPLQPITGVTSSQSGSAGSGSGRRTASGGTSGSLSEGNIPHPNQGLVSTSDVESQRLQDWERQQQRQQIAKGLTVVTQPPTPGFTPSPPAVNTEASTSQKASNSHDFETGMGSKKATMAATMTSTSASPLSAVSGSAPGSSGTGTGTGASSAASYEDASRPPAYFAYQPHHRSETTPQPRLQHMNSYTSQHPSQQILPKNSNFQNLPRLSTPPTFPVSLPAVVPPMQLPPPPSMTALSHQQQQQQQTGPSPPPLSSGSAGMIPPVLPPRPSATQQSSCQPQHSRPSGNTPVSSISNASKHSSGGPGPANPSVAGVASPIMLQNISSPVYSTSPSSPSHMYPSQARNKAQQPPLQHSPSAPTHALPAIPQHGGPSAAPVNPKLGFVRLQVTVDNENFSVVDVSGVGSSEAIMERVFSKLRFRDDDHPSLAMFRTDIGETPETTPVGKDKLFELCRTDGDAKGGLKFLIVQTAILPSPSSMAVPPAILHAGASTLFANMGSPVDPSRKTFSAGSASLQGDRDYMQPQSNASAHHQSGYLQHHGGHSHNPYYIHSHAMHHHPPQHQTQQQGYGQPMSRHHGSRHSKEGSVSSASAGEVGPSGLRQSGQSKYDNGVYETSPADANAQTPYFSGSTSGSTGTNNSLARTQGMSKRRLPSSSASRGSQSPAEERRGMSTRLLNSTPPPLDYSISSTGSGSTAPFPLTVGSSTTTTQQPGYFAGSATPTLSQYVEQQKKQQSVGNQSQRTQQPLPLQLHTDSPEFVMSPETARTDGRNVFVGPYDPPNNKPDWERSPSEPTEADMAEILRLEQEDAEREKQRRRQMEEEDRKVAIQEQQKEHAAWEAQQNAERDARTRQIQADRLTAEMTVQQERDRAQREEKEAEQMEEARTKQVAKERREKRLQWESRSHMIERMRGMDGLANMSPEWLYGEEGSTLRPGMLVPPMEPSGSASRQASSSMTQTISQETVRPLRQHPQSSRTPLRSSRPQEVPATYGYEDAYEGLAGGETYGVYQDPFTDHGCRSPEPRLRPQHAYTTSASNIGHSQRPIQSHNEIRTHAQSVEAVIPTGSRSHPSFQPEESIYEDDAVTRRRLQYPSHPFATARALGNERNNTSLRNREYSPEQRLPPHQSLPPGRIAFPEPRPSGVRADRRGSESGVISAMLPAGSPDKRRKASLADIYNTQLNFAEPRQPDSHGTYIDRPTRNYAVEDDATIGPSHRSEAGGTQIEEKEDDSGGTARAEKWANDIRNMFGDDRQRPDEGTVRPGAQTAETAEEGPEETLWFVPPSAGTAVPTDRITQSQSKPALKLNTDSHMAENHDIDRIISAEGSGLLTASSASDSRDGFGLSGRVQRTKSFARTKDQWNERPNAEHVYDHLEEFFPKIDLDRPVLPEPAVHLAVIDPTSPRTESPEPYAEAKHERATSPKGKLAFNRAENRKSIRFVAQDRKRHLSKIAPAVNAPATSLERKRSSSMWGHKTVEVTPAKLKHGQVPGIAVGGVAPDGKPETMTWVKGDLIGKGTYGRVYLGLNATTGDMMAVKQVELPTNDRERQDKRQAGMIKALRDEIELLKNLEHPHIVQYLGWEESPEHISIFLEYVPGGSIASVYRKHQKFEEEVIKNFTKQILSGLAYLHAKGILHRDLKADNILVDSDGTCKITDFGISKQAEDAYASQGATNLKGSVFWMAPEVIRNMGRGYSAKVDIWSLGCLVLEMFAGRRPWGEDSVLTAMFSVGQHNKKPPIPDDVVLSSTANDFMTEKCLAIEPNQRPTAEELKRHPFITEFDPNWTFADSNLGKLVNAGTRKR
ncbi:hypothetical protein QFC21_000038 [Naganishia friedmannii]|uniref:Uncharacterized protein n=1 Tax=Naganishia friedmannii TaxID=89922 RepID=A0ACC2WB93_9TREE|nr:hypothetical protein QFC21_000038 [Naganishia friedmannii]